MAALRADHPRHRYDRSAAAGLAIPAGFRADESRHKTVLHGAEPYRRHVVGHVRHRLDLETARGERIADKLLINVVRSFGAGEWDIARLVVVPNSLPFIIVGLRLAIGRAVLGVVVAEFFGSQDGLGVVMVRAASQFKVDIVFAGLIVFAALSLVMTGLVKLLEDRLTRWRPQHSNAG